MDADADAVVFVPSSRRLVASATLVLVLELVLLLLLLPALFGGRRQCCLCSPQFILWCSSEQYLTDLHREHLSLACSPHTKHRSLQLGDDLTGRC